MKRDIISDLQAREILDSRGDPTVEVTVLTEGGITGMASVPSGASTGIHEAYELRDGDKNRYDGKGVLQAIGHVNKEIKQVIRGVSVTEQQRVDTIMIDLDGTTNKKNLGANAILGVSLAVARAGAAATGLPLYRYLQQVFDLEQKIYSLPVPMMNIFNGGVHADNNLAVQEFMVVPEFKRGQAADINESIRVGAEVFHSLGRVLKSHKLDTDVGNEGGYAPEVDSSQTAIDLILEAIDRAGYQAGGQVNLALDVAASEFFRQGKYHFEGKVLKSGEMIDLYEEWQKKYQLVSLEDGLAQDDWQGWTEMTRRLDDKLLLVGDDLFVTSIQRLQLGLEFKAANTILIKPNQVGTLTETIATVSEAQQKNLKIIVSHRSGETMDSFIADLAVAVGAQYIKSGPTSRGERVAKYNRLMEIATELKSLKK
ncbi:MAG: Enolase [Parcubacteria group bacterium GW2011_GWD2_43_10]|uniref:Enolase n=1 Tax=Candidatus Veblenbacteria bacterium RIFOXYD1_FULL_43_11 TaxID=1802429 RepID=A0A1G2Q6X2_9BACT|nr:MAG: Enolase [Parcubacteria group bacterium GW2011_GWD2_43_10]KKT12179.1 MAG: Enolase [Parcubacteria group bacterium GW2011_GWA1_43_27]KKT14821.1 MAG: Enolase [Parcubacteria group bacterium GW2011_GWF2_43_38]KKT16479.1 MAG: Enolase [Parcubacteria group bacterium GW2011_GWB1_43_66]KKT22494.1 MAG: Enolase [Parcubacteria group bacterium GW2011_GWE1_43_8]KKT26370.1 MAG: Enolase [Parcubacteria group bacterium GW2011_GWF1_43_9]OHA56288.1 MAG: phosphopyruvate hydratase [Candidatus Veblenbacteria 